MPDRYSANREHTAESCCLQGPGAYTQQRYECRHCLLPNAASVLYEAIIEQ